MSYIRIYGRFLYEMRKLFFYLKKSMKNYSYNGIVLLFSYNKTVCMSDFRMDATDEVH